MGKQPKEFIERFRDLLIAAGAAASRLSLTNLRNFRDFIAKGKYNPVDTTVDARVNHTIGIPILVDTPVNTISKTNR